MIFQKHLKKFAILKVVFLLCTCVIHAKDCSAALLEQKDKSTLGELRSKTLKNWDRMLTWAFSKKNSDYLLSKPPRLESFSMDIHEILNFDATHGYFSPDNPIVGKSTNSKEDISITECLLKVMAKKIKAEEQMQFSLNEVLCKVLAYRALEKGMEVAIPELYVVDEVIDLWHGMPAFGLIPKNNKEAIPILLFRGTDLALSTERGWASILSDLDVSGPGFSTFMDAKPKIHEWLKKVAALGVPARVMGVSLGGVFASYAYIFEHALLNKVPSIAFNPPGVSKEVFIRWASLPKDAPPLHVYVTKGDFISKIGYLVGEIKEMKLSRPLRVIEAHVTLIAAQKEYMLGQVDLAEENNSRKNTH